MRTEEKYMHRALMLARKGVINAFPNPMVGAVIVDEKGNIIGEGYHRKCGEAHAEVNAINSVKDPKLLTSSTMYVTMEPCAHYGRTGPCCELIAKVGIPRVVVGTRDPFEKVNGRGIEFMREAGIDVEVGMLEKECRDLNVFFFTAHTLHRPFICLKWAKSEDGFMDIKRGPGEPAAQLSTPFTQLVMHRIRSMFEGILVGSGTVLEDNPVLDTRLWPDRVPRPIILDRRGRLDANYKIMGRNPLIIRDDKPLPDLMRELYDQGIVSLLVEGGPTVLESFLKEGLWDLARVEVAPITFGEYGRAEAPFLFGKEPVKVINFEGNTIKYYSQNPLIDVKNI